MDAAGLLQTVEQVAPAFRRRLDRDVPPSSTPDGHVLVSGKEQVSPAPGYAAATRRCRRARGLCRASSSRR